MENIGYISNTTFILNDIVNAPAVIFANLSNHFNGPVTWGSISRCLFESNGGAQILIHFPVGTPSMYSFNGSLIEISSSSFINNQDPSGVVQLQFQGLFSFAEFFLCEKLMHPSQDLFYEPPSSLLVLITDCDISFNRGVAIVGINLPDFRVTNSFIWHNTNGAIHIDSTNLHVENTSVYLNG